MKTDRLFRKFRVLGIVLLVLLVTGTGASCQYSKEENYWKNLSGTEKRQAINLELERVWEDIFLPAPQPERCAHVTAETLEHSMRIGADWIIAMQEHHGRFQYWYDPVSDKFSSKDDDNFLRQAGTSFSLALVYEMTGEFRYLEAARRSVQYLLTFIEPLDVDKAYFLFRKKAKLGGISLPMLTMLKIRQLTGTTEFDAILTKLTNMILFLQEKYNTGQYKSTYVYRGDYEYEKKAGWESKIYPGEALYALAGMYQAFRDPRYKESMDWALEFYYREKWKAHAFLPWTISAFASLYEQTGERKYADYVFFLSDQLLTKQNLDSDDEAYGSFHGMPSANTGGYMEGLGDAIHVARLTGDEVRLRVYQERAKMGYRWLFMLQYGESDAAALKRPDMAQGGFRKTLTDSQLRIDNTQHAISSFAKGLRFIYEIPPAVQLEPLNHVILDHSLELGTQFILNHQKPEGNFTYTYDWVKKAYDPSDNQVRQAGVMWGLALIYNDSPNPKVGAAVEKAMDFFARNSKLTRDGHRYVTYPGDEAGRIGTVALCALAHIDYLRVAKFYIAEEKFQHYRQLLDEYLEFLIKARIQTGPTAGLWHKNYSIAAGHPYGKSSPYFDGESLLALIKAAKYMGREDLQSIIIASADIGYHHNIQQALQEDPDSSITKGYYQWSSMIFFEIATSGWPNTEKYGNYVIDLANWMIEVHKTLSKPRNTAYAYEGIIHAYQLAVERNDTKHIEKFAGVIEAGLKKLTSWQVGSPLMNGFIRSQPIDNPLAIGGVQNHRRESLLRIDVTQHQMHAVILARRYVYK